MPRMLGVRNFILIPGASYLSAWLVTPLWIPFTRLADGRAYHSGWESFWMHIFNTIPIVLGSALTGIMVGYFLETAKPLAWALTVGLFVGISDWSSTHWYVKAETSDLLVQGITAFIAAAIAFYACWLIERRHRVVASRDAPA